jgi:hypothetical protein
MKHNTEKKKLSNFVIPEGLRIDLDEGWKKIISRQFGGNPGRGFGELIQNFLDSYDPSVPWSQRRGVITFGENWISLKDFGSGLDLKKIKLVTKMGGTDKHADPNKIGKFGIGFFSIFNPKLGTRKVEIITKCEGQAVKLEYIILEDGQRPKLDSEVLDYSIDFSTEVKVYFDRPGSVRQCIDYGKNSLKYYPCDIQINGNRFQSVWEEAAYSNAFFFDRNHCNGFFKTGNRFRSTTILCKYEYISEMPLRYFITGGYNVHHNLDDYYATETPFIPGLEMVLNCNQLSVTISRDSFYLDYNYKNMISDMNESLLELMDQQFNGLLDEVKLANLYILRKRIKSFWKGLKGKPTNPSPSESVFYKLLNSKLFRLNGKKKLFSLLELQRMKSQGIPLFFSERKTNLRWLGGAFKHDFIVLPEECQVDKGAPGLNNALLSTLFDDVVNLDTIGDDRTKINSLIEREIIRKESLEPDCNFIETRVLSKKENQLLARFETLLNRPEILETIVRNLNIPVKKIHPSFFILKNGGMHISTGIFDQHQNPINDDFISNFIKQKEEASAEERLAMKNTILLGLCLNHPFIRKLIASEDPHKEYFALTYIAHELTSCQKLLAPYSSFFQLVKSRLSSELQKNMLAELVKEK